MYSLIIFSLVVSNRSLLLIHLLLVAELFCFRCGDQGHMVRDCDQTEDCRCSLFFLSSSWHEVYFLRKMLFSPQHATTATGVVTFPGTVRSPNGRGSSSATIVEKLVTWPVSATMPMSRSASPVGHLATSRNFAIK